MVPFPPEGTCKSPSPPSISLGLIIYTPHSEKYVEIFATWQAKLYSVLSRIPKWAFLVVSGSVGSLLIQAMHAWGKKKEQKPKRVVVKPASAVPPPAAADAAATAAASVGPAKTAKTRSEGSPSGGRRRKNARK